MKSCDNIKAVESEVDLAIKDQGQPKDIGSTYRLKCAQKQSA